MQGRLLGYLVLLVCVAAVWYRSGRGQPKTQRGRLRELAYCVALVVLVAFAVNRAPSTMWAAVVAAVILIFAPRLAMTLVPIGLILFGLYGLDVAGSSGFWSFSPGNYLFLRTGGYDMTYYLVLPLAYALLGLGSFLFWRNADHDAEWFKRVFGRMASARGLDLLGFLLLPVTIALAAMLNPLNVTNQGSGRILAPLFLITAGLLVIRKWPRAAAGLATGGLILLGLAGLLVANRWDGYNWATPNGYVLDGVVAYASRTIMAFALAQSVGFVALGAFLVPKAINVSDLPNPELLKRIQRLTESRAEVVDTAAADLRRLERDLHDGAQARLVALGMSLRAVERLIPTNPDAALALVAEAREASARALTELRELVRGVHPPVLADRGLADAIRALALDTPMKIETDIDLPGRVAAPVETACYFAVAEVLTNAAKHSGAREGKISVGHADGALRIAVTDFGVGGADPARGTGLVGVEKRLASFDGLLAVSSPLGGPTIVVIEVPCAISSSVVRVPAVS
jgi:signal transduction histidine kinase